MNESRINWSVLDMGLFKWGAISLLASLVLTGIYLLTADDPEPILPAESLFAPIGLDDVAVGAGSEAAANDFVTRPLFLAGRKPPAPPKKVTAKPKPVAPPEPEPEPIDDFALMGLYGSGDLQGAIVRDKEGKRLRIHVGQKVNGWELASIDGRAANFVFGARKGRLEMAFATAKPLKPVKMGLLNSAPGDRELNQNESGDPADESAQSMQNQNEKRDINVSTFGGAYRAKLDRIAADGSKVEDSGEQPKREPKK